MLYSNLIVLLSTMSFSRGMETVSAYNCGVQIQSYIECLQQAKENVSAPTSNIDVLTRYDFEKGLSACFIGSGCVEPDLPADTTIHTMIYDRNFAASECMNIVESMSQDNIEICINGTLSDYALFDAPSEFPEDDTPISLMGPLWVFQVSQQMRSQSFCSVDADLDYLEQCLSALFDKVFASGKQFEHMQQKWHQFNSFCQSTASCKTQILSDNCQQELYAKLDMINICVDDEIKTNRYQWGEKFVDCMNDSAFPINDTEMGADFAEKAIKRFLQMTSTAELDACKNSFFDQFDPTSGQPFVHNQQNVVFSGSGSTVESRLVPQQSSCSESNVDGHLASTAVAETSEKRDHLKTSEDDETTKSPSTEVHSTKTTGSYKIFINGRLIQWN